ncbi:glycosyl hydrolase [Microcoleus sp. FACHB-1515]|nr:glycosyl hydrolase [Microcoleus sp. FACHB-1515]
MGASKTVSPLLTGCILLLLTGCVTVEKPSAPPVTTSPVAASPTTPATESASEDLALLQESWQAYRARFVQDDGRVIDREAGDRTTSEGQAYAMLRAVMIDDRDTFDRTLAWAEANLQRRDASGRRSDALWCWKWGKNADGNWGVIDSNFASDGDLDAITALIFAARRWNEPQYLDVARTKLADLWELSVAEANGKNYFLPGPKIAFQPQPTELKLNPSYLAPYAFRLFAQVDRDRDWLNLVDSSYEVLNESARLSAINLPSDWVALDTTTGSYQPLTPPSSIRSIYGFDAYRVWWRVALDSAWFDEPRAKEFLRQHLPPLQSMLQQQQKVPAQIDLQGQPLVNYDSTSQYAMLYAAFAEIDPQVAEQIRQEKLLPTYRDGFWDNDAAYYSQNLSWFGLFFPIEIPTSWLQP